jgi:hypothetical protein
MQQQYQQQTAHLHILGLEIALLPAPLRLQPQMQVHLRTCNNSSRSCSSAAA